MNNKNNSRILFRTIALTSLLCLLLPLSLLGCQNQAEREEVERVFYVWRLSDFTRQFAMDVEIIESESEETQFILTPTEYTYKVIDELNSAVRTLMNDGRMVYREGVGLVIPAEATGDPEDVIFENLKYPLTIHKVHHDRIAIQDLHEDMWIRPIIVNIGAELNRLNPVSDYMRRRWGESGG